MTDLIIETGKVKTRDDQEVRIYATDAGGDYPVHGAVKTDHGWESETWTLGGFYYADDPRGGGDLISIPQPQYFNIYTYLIGGIFIGAMWDSIDEANQQVDKSDSIDFYETFQYLHGEVTKVEPEGGE